MIKYTVVSSKGKFFDYLPRDFVDLTTGITLAPTKEEALEHYGDVESATIVGIDENGVIMEKYSFLQGFGGFSMLTHFIKKTNGILIYKNDLNGEYYFTIDEQNWTFADKNLDMVDKIAKDYPLEYKVGEEVIVNSWTGKANAIVEDIAWIYHHRQHEYVWGYKLKYINSDPLLTMTYVPEGYLSKLNPKTESVNIVICNKGYCKSVADGYVGMHKEGEKCPACEAIEEKAKQWFGDGEIDVNLMISSGAATLDQIVKMYRKEVLHEPY